MGHIIKGLAKLEMVIGELRGVFHGLLQCGNGAVSIFLQPVEDAEMEVGSGIGGLQLDGAFEV